VHDSSEPALTQELWGSGEVRNKRKQIQNLIETLAMENNEVAHLAKEAGENKQSEEPKPEDMQKKREDEKRENEEREELNEDNQKDQKRMEEQRNDGQSDVTRNSPRGITRRKKPLRPTRLAPKDEAGVIEIE